MWLKLYHDGQLDPGPVLVLSWFRVQELSQRDIMVLHLEHCIVPKRIVSLTLKVDTVKGLYTRSVMLLAKQRLQARQPKAQPCTSMIPEAGMLRTATNVIN